MFLTVRGTLSGRNPSAAVREKLGGDWPEFTAENEAYLSISKTPRVVYKSGPYGNRAALWNTLLPQLQALTSATGRDEGGQKERGKDEL